MRSPRVAPPIAGRAALERIDADAVLALADPDDRDGDGISGRARMIATGGGEALGRYGWKAQSTGLEDQIADAFAMDIGLSSALRPFPHGDCTEREPDCMAAPTGESDRYDGQELSPEIVGLVAAYVRSLKAPTPHVDATAIDLFAATGCAACHVPEHAGEGRRDVSPPTPIFFCMTWAPGSTTASASRGRIGRVADLAADRHGAGRAAGAICMTAAPRRSMRQFAPMAARRRKRECAISRLSDDERRALVAYLESL